MKGIGIIMERYTRSEISNKIPMEFDIEVNIIPKYTTDEIKSAMYKGFEIPDGEVISGIKNAIITDQIEADYNAFIESVEDLLMEYYGLELFYENVSPDYSHYYSFLAKDKATGEVYFRFRLRFRISNHPAHKSGASQKHKREETKTDRYKELTKDISKDPRPYSKSITVNKELYSSYEAAFIDIDKQVEEWVTTMKK